jgi:cell wall-associated NlpC family hydrolase
MPRRLVIPAFVSVAFLVLSGGSALADGTSVAVRPVKSPAQFVLPPKPPRLTLAERAVAIARKQLGTPYRWGGASPGGFDCSGLVSWVYGRLGFDLPHNAAALYGIGRPVKGSRLRPGDLLFFHGLGHVGLYIGRGRMIHAPQSGRRVEIQSLAVRRGSLIGARRLVTRG